MLIESPFSSEDCQFCSVVSQKSGEDPLGTAGCYDRWLLIQLPQPWEAHFWENQPELQPLVNLVFKLMKEGKLNKFRPLAIAPDQLYSHPDLTRVFYYSHQDELFNDLQKTEYLLPFDRVSELAIALITQETTELDKFQQYRQDNDNTREILVCMHGNVDVACSHFGYPVYKKLREELATDNLRIWRCSHIGGHRFAPTLIDFPSGRFWGHLTLDILDTLINNPTDIDKLRPYYRGWSGLPNFAQIFEAQLWQEKKDTWHHIIKKSRIIAQEDVTDDNKPNWVEVEISYLEPNTDKIIDRQARLEIKQEITSLSNSGTDKFLTAKQYQITSHQ